MTCLDELKQEARLLVEALDRHDDATTPVSMLYRLREMRADLAWRRARTFSAEGPKR